MVKKGYLKNKVYIIDLFREGLQKDTHKYGDAVCVRGK